MSKKGKDFLHELIHTLSKSEKRYYKLFASRHLAKEDSTMIPLFDFIARQDTYDEDQLILAFKGKALLNQLATAKRRLYEHILQALDAFYVNASVEAQLNRMLHQAQLLYNKSLYDQCIKHLRTVEKLASRNDLFLPLIQAGKLRKRIQHNHDAVHLLEHVQSNLQTAALQNEHFIHQLESIAIQAVANNNSATSLNILKQLPSEKEMERFNKPEGHYLFHRIQAECYKHLGQLGVQLIHLEKAVEAYELHPRKQEINHQLPELLLERFLLLDQDDQKEIQRGLLRTKQSIELIKADATDAVHFHLTCLLAGIETVVLSATETHSKGTAYISKLTRLLESEEEHPPSAIQSWLKMIVARLLFLQADFSKTIKWTHVLLETKKSIAYETVLLLHLAAYYELNEIGPLDSEIKRIRKTVKTDKVSDELLLFINGMAKLKELHRLDHEEVFTLLVHQLSTTEAMGKNTYFDALTWIECKIRNTSYRQALEEKKKFVQAG